MSNIKKIIKIQYTDMYEKFFWGSFGKYLQEEYELEFSDEPDFLFYSVYGTGLDHYKYKNCIKIFYSTEGVLPDFNECDYAIGFYPLEVKDRYLQVLYELPSLIRREAPLNVEDKLFCNFVYSNEKNGEGAILRKKFCEELMKYKHVDCPGQVLNNMRGDIGARNASDWYASKTKFVRKYKFTIAFENDSMLGMTTEKLFQPLLVGSVPIYWGNPDVDSICNPKSFINCNGCTIEEMVNKVIEIDQNDELYNQMIKSKAFDDGIVKSQEEKIREFISYIMNSGKIFVKNPLNMDNRARACEVYDKLNLRKIDRIYNKFVEKK